MSERRMPDIVGETGCLNNVGVYPILRGKLLLMDV
jgi:hypothetical protein